jgi:hypothetical protein
MVFIAIEQVLMIVEQVLILVLQFFTSFKVSVDSTFTFPFAFAIEVL